MTGSAFMEVLQSSIELICSAETQGTLYTVGCHSRNTELIFVTAYHVNIVLNSATCARSTDYNTSDKLHFANLEQYTV